MGFYLHFKAISYIASQIHRYSSVAAHLMRFYKSRNYIPQNGDGRPIGGAHSFPPTFSSTIKQPVRLRKFPNRFIVFVRRYIAFSAYTRNWLLFLYARNGYLKTVFRFLCIVFAESVTELGESAERRPFAVDPPLKIV